MLSAASIVRWIPSRHLARDAAVLIALVVPALVVGAQCVREPAHGDGPSVIRDGDSYTVAWGDWDQLRTSVYVHTFPRLGSTTARPVRVMRTKQLVDVPEIVKTDRGYVVIANRGPDGIAAVRLTPARKPAGEVRTIFEGAAKLCGTPAWTGTAVVLGLATVEDSGDLVYHLVRITAGGGAAAVDTVAAGDAAAPSCALALGDDHVAFAAVFGDSDGEVVAVARLFDDGRFEPVQVDRGRDVAVRGLAAHRGAAVIAYRRDSEARAARVAADGEIDAATLRGVDARTFDAVDAGAGWAAAWQAGPAIAFALFDRDGEPIERVRHERRAEGSAVRLIRDGEECAVSWSEANGSLVWLWVFNVCEVDAQISPAADVTSVSGSR